MIMIRKCFCMIVCSGVDKYSWDMLRGVYPVYILFVAKQELIGRNLATANLGGIYRKLGAFAALSSQVQILAFL